MNQNKRAAIRRWYWLRRHLKAKRRVYRGSDHLGRATFVVLRHGHIEIRTQRNVPGFDVLGPEAKTEVGDQVRFVGIDPKGYWEPASEWLWPGALVKNHPDCIFRRKRCWAPKSGGVE